jgi:hypothetical protein
MSNLSPLRLPICISVRNCSHGQARTLTQSQRRNSKYGSATAAAATTAATAAAAAAAAFSAATFAVASRQRRQRVDHTWRFGSTKATT